MIRNCSVAIVLWIALMAGYGYYLRDKFPGYPEKILVPVVMGSVTAAGLALIHGTRFQIADWRARNRSARGERPRDGGLVAAIGEIHPTFETLQAPFTGRECVIYTYDFGIVRTEANYAARDYTGYGMTRCAIRTPYGELTLGSFPTLEQFHKKPSDPRVAFDYVSTATLEPVSGVAAFVKSMVAAHSTPPPFKRDWKVGTPSADATTGEALETIVAPGDVVTAYGRYVAASNSIVTDTKAKGFLRLSRGGNPLKTEAVPWKAIQSFFGGVAIVAAANGVMWLLLQRAQ